MAVIGRVIFAEAGTEPVDADPLKACGGEAVEGTVWYRYEATQDGLFVFDASTLDEFRSGAALITEAPADRKSIALCGDGYIVGDVEADDVLWFAAFSRTPNPTGTLRVSIDFRLAGAVDVRVEAVTCNPVGCDERECHHVQAASALRLRPPGGGEGERGGSGVESVTLGCADAGRLRVSRP